MKSGQDPEQTESGIKGAHGGNMKIHLNFTPNISSRATTSPTTRHDAAIERTCKSRMIVVRVG